MMGEGLGVLGSIFMAFFAVFATGCWIFSMRELHSLKKLSCPVDEEKLIDYLKEVKSYSLFGLICSYFLLFLSTTLMCYYLLLGGLLSIFALIMFFFSMPEYLTVLEELKPLLKKREFRKLLTEIKEE